MVNNFSSSSSSMFITLTGILPWNVLFKANFFDSGTSEVLLFLAIVLCDSRLLIMLPLLLLLLGWFEIR